MLNIRSQISSGITFDNPIFTIIMNDCHCSFPLDSLKSKEGAFNAVIPAITELLNMCYCNTEQFNKGMLNDAKKVAL